MLDNVVVIGSGPAGLAGACLLAKKGYKVEVYESYHTYGGKLGTINLNGSIFDTGPSLLTEPRIIDDIYIECSKNPRHYWDYIRVSEGTNYFWPDGKYYPMPANKAQIIKTLCNQFDVSHKKVIQYFNMLEYQYKQVAPLFLDKPMNMHSINNIKHINKLVKTLPLFVQTSDKYNQKAFTDNKVVQIFNRFATYSGSDPYLGPALLNLAGSPELIDGVYYPKGGMRSIVDGLYNLACELGVKFNFNSKIGSIKSNNKGFVIVTKNKQLNCKKIIYAGDYASIYKLLGLSEKFKSYTNKSMSTSGLVFYWQVRGSHYKLGLHNIMFSQNYRQEFEHLRDLQLVKDPTIYINITSKKEPSLSKKDFENWFVMLNVPAGYKANDIQKVALATKHKIEKILGCKISINAQSYLTPQIIEQNSGSYNGAIYGRDSNNIVRATLKPSYNFKGISGLYCIGGSTHPGGGVPLSVRSAKIMADKL